ncbi:hypothetical protein CHARACLAT_025278 [Characodon lateralis]|uniref:Uncharacterized protein n=1 Tax=Characodon lateralis TaxID=208331 RepID=A0ABU7F5X8_9TELE|nr:hypothetical protein [Characodon lateralis]
MKSCARKCSSGLLLLVALSLKVLLTGRRNALHDILQSPTDPEGRQLPLTLSLSQLHINAGGGDEEDAEDSHSSSTTSHREADQRNS